MRLKRFIAPLGLATVVALAILAALFWLGRHRGSQVVHAALYAQSLNAAESLQDSSGGIAQYGYAIQQASDLSADAQAIADWDTYVASRSGWSMSSTLCTRLANGDWNARQAGPPAITPQQLANAVNHLISSVLSTMTASQQTAMFQQNMSAAT